MLPVMYVAKQISKHTEYVGELAWPLLNNELYRLATFAKYPLNAAKSAVSLAADGFVYTDQDDSVTCIFCQSHKNKWQPTDNIRETHRALSCNCPMVTRTFCSNIPVKANRNHNLIIQSIAPCIIQQKATCDGLSSASATDQLNTIRALTIQATENVLQYSPAKNVSNLAMVETGKHLSVQNVSHKDTAELARVAPKKAYGILQNYTKNLIISEYFHIFITKVLTYFIRSSNVKLETNAMPKVKLSLDSDDLTTTGEKVSMARHFQSASSSNNYKHINYCSWLSYKKPESYVLLPQDDTSCVKHYDYYFSYKSNDTYLCPVLPYRNQPVDVYAQLAIDYNNSHYKNRLLTFRGWPVHHAVSCVLLAQNGLVFDHEVDEVSCPACNFSRTVQEVGHTIISDHRNYSPGCLLASACQQESTYNSIFNSVTDLANNQVTNNQVTNNHEHSSERVSASHTGPTTNNTEAAFPESPFIVPTSTTLSSVTTASRGTVADSSRATATAAPISCSLTSSPQPYPKPAIITMCGAADELQPVSLATSPSHQVNLRPQNTEGCAYPQNTEGCAYPQNTEGCAYPQNTEGCAYPQNTEGCAYPQNTEGCAYPQNTEGCAYPEGKGNNYSITKSIIPASSGTAASLESAPSLKPEKQKPKPTLRDMAIQPSDVVTKLADVTVDDRSTASTMFRENVINDTETVCKQKENFLIKIRNEDFADLQQRIASIQMYKRQYSLKALELAEAGFYWEGKENVLKCFCCGVRLRHKGHSGQVDGWIVHAKFSQHCQWVYRQKGQCFVNIVQDLVKTDRKKKITTEMVYSRCGAAASSLLEQPGLSLSADIVNSKKQDEL
ncbi:baculoviral IAP repeat-containing protein 2 isoform X1 [Biomphalaria glabrata]|nr:baculoviral IAP repeat-containing protein 2 isoform X1 [Biomphalaria glabrata]